MKQENGTFTYPMYVRLERTSRGTGKQYKQWVFVGWSTVNLETLQQGKRKGGFILVQEAVDLVRYEVSEEEFAEMEMEAAEAVENTIEKGNDEMNKETVKTMKELFLNPKAVMYVEAKNLKYFSNKSPKEARALFADKEVRRNVKKAMKNEIERKSACDWEFDKVKHEDLINFWVRVPEHGESQKRAWIIKGDIDNAKNVLDKLGFAWEGVEINSPYDCTGQWFAWEASFTQLEDRVFVTQHWGLDV